MAVIRLILLVAVLGGLTLLLAQNWSPVLSLTFLGMQTQGLPLAIWILFSTAAGAFTSVFITSVFKLSNYFATEQRQTRFTSTATPPRQKTTPRVESQSNPASPPPSTKQEYSQTEAFDDWNTDGSENDDWDFEQKPREGKTFEQQTPDFRDNQTYERQQEPQSSTRSGSVYSYNYRDPKNTAVGKTESIYDADYRVIIPPYQPPTNNQADEDDWSFFDDDEDSEDKDQPSGR